jgi:hypothetical protein
MRARCIPFVLSVAALLTPAGEAWSRTIFDGAWSVIIITERGEACDRANAYSIRIDNGAVRYAGGYSIQLAGRVAPTAPCGSPSRAAGGTRMASAGCREISAAGPGVAALPPGSVPAAGTLSAAKSVI